MSRTDTQPIRFEEPGPETNSPSAPQTMDSNASDDLPVAVGHQPYVDWALLRESQGLGRQLNHKAGLPTSVDGCMGLPEGPVDGNRDDQVAMDQTQHGSEQAVPGSEWDVDIDTLEAMLEEHARLASALRNKIAGYRDRWVGH